LGLGLVEPPKDPQRDRGVGDRLGVVRPELQRPLEARQSGLRLAQRLEHDPVIVERIDVVRLQRQRAGVAAGRLLEPPLPLVRHPEIAVVRGRVRLDLDRPRDQLDRRLRMPELIRQHTQQVQGGPVGRVGCQHLAVDRLGLGEAPGLVVGPPLRQRLLDRRLG
jgi:hypothetical protein